MIARFDPDLTARINRYKDAVWYQGNRSMGQIRWMIRDELGSTVYCDQCGNIANGVLFEQIERYILKIPRCKSHLEEWMIDHPDYQWNESNLSLIKPGSLLGMAGMFDKELAEKNKS